MMKEEAARMDAMMRQLMGSNEEEGILSRKNNPIANDQRYSCAYL